MQFSEDDLRQALKRKDPGPEFTQRVLARISQPETMTKRGEVPRRRGLYAWFPMFRLSPALVAAVAVLLLVGAWIGYQSYQHHEREARIVELQQQAEAKKAQQQTILALRIASEKLNHVFQRVNGAPPPEDKIRRQRL